VPLIRVAKRPARINPCWLPRWSKGENLIDFDEKRIVDVCFYGYE